MQIEMVIAVLIHLYCRSEGLPSSECSFTAAYWGFRAPSCGFAMQT